MATIRGSRSSSASGPAKTRSRPTATPCCARPRRRSARPGAISISAPIPMPARCSATTCTHCRTRSARRSAHRPCSPPGTPRSMSRKSRINACRRRSAAAPIWRPRKRCCRNTAGCGSGMNPLSSRASGVWADGSAAAPAPRPSPRWRLDRAVAARPFRRRAAARAFRARDDGFRDPSGRRHPSRHRRRLREEAAVASILVTAGDADRPAGPFCDSLDLLASGLVERHGIGHVLFAAYPEGHPGIGAGVLERALRHKLALARAHGLDATLLTQFGFEPAPIRQWLAGLPARGVLCPVRIGVAGPASVARIAQFAVHCGLVAMLPALACRHAALPRILTEVAPDALLRALFAEPLAGAPVAGLHIFTFGGVRRTAEWLGAWRAAA